ncbi:MAG: DoxX family protein [Chloroflexota bacterium]
MKIALWIVQVLLGAAFIMAGFMKITTPIAEMAEMMSFVTVFPEAMVRFIGIAEVAGGIGVILPALTRIQPRLTPIAAACLGLVMILAAIYHITQGEFSAIISNIVLFALAAFVYYGRTKVAPIAPR